MVLEAGKMLLPTDIQFDVPNDTIYVVEQFNNRVSKWDFTPGDFDFTLDASWGSNGDGTSGVAGTPTDGGATDENFYHPTGIALHSGVLFVSDTMNHRIRRINSNTGAFEGTMGSPGTGDDELYRPAYLIPNSGNDLLVIADSFNHRVVTYNAVTPFNFIDVADPPAEGFHTPNGVMFDSTGTDFIFVSDKRRGRIAEYNGVAGNTPIFIGTPGSSADPGVLFNPGNGHGFDETPSGSQIFADTQNNAIKTVSTGGTFTNEIQRNPGTGPEELYHPASAAGWDKDGTHYNLIANTKNHRIDAWNEDFSVLEQTFGSPFT